ncbi:MAG: FAD-dependent thymidylate synthase [Methanobacteriota archaeon]|nr:MAG: FAD-dependent thymidylate synthase [Euryarchaeota archaeon]
MSSSSSRGSGPLKAVRPLVIKIGETKADPQALAEVLRLLGVSDEYSDWFIRTRGSDAQALIEFAGRMCYESYQPHLNPNVTKIREDPEAYYRNILTKGDGSILEQSHLIFALLNISRVCSHEIVRHRVGTSISQESLRYVRPRDLKFWVPDELPESQKTAMMEAVEQVEAAYRKLEQTVPWDKLSMDEKKRLTSAFRRILPDGIATSMIWGANHRTLRWVIEMRTDPAAEVEIRMVFDQIAEICKRDYPLIYGDFASTDLPDGTKAWRPSLKSKV